MSVSAPATDKQEREKEKNKNNNDSNINNNNPSQVPSLSDKEKKPTKKPDPQSAESQTIKKIIKKQRENLITRPIHQHPLVTGVENESSGPTPAPAHLPQHSVQQINKTARASPQTRSQTKTCPGHTLGNVGQSRKRTHEQANEEQTERPRGETAEDSAPHPSR